MANLADDKARMQKSLDNLRDELNSIRAGRANPHVLDKVMVNYYGADTPLQQVANVTVPEPRMIQIQPWEPSLLKDIEKAIMISDVGINPTNDGKVIRLVFPDLTEEHRKELAKDIKKKGEAAKVAVRNVRRDSMDKVKAKKKSNEITEDEVKDIEKDISKNMNEKKPHFDIHLYPNESFVLSLEEEYAAVKSND